MLKCLFASLLYSLSRIQYHEKDICKEWERGVQWVSLSYITTTTGCEGPVFCLPIISYKVVWKKLMWFCSFKIWCFLICTPCKRVTSSCQKCQISTILLDGYTLLTPLSDIQESGKTIWTACQKAPKVAWTWHTTERYNDNNKPNELVDMSFISIF